MTAPKTIFIISKYLMFQDGLKSLLSQQGEVEIVGWTMHPDLALDQVQTLQPDVVIFDNTRMSSEQTTHLKQRILHIYPAVKVINLNLDSNQLSIYQRLKQHAVASYQVLGGKVEDVTDLVKAIIGGSESPPSSQTAAFN